MDKKLLNLSDVPRNCPAPTVATLLPWLSRKLRFGDQGGGTLPGKRPFTSTWGMTPDEWADAREHLRAVLADVASARTTITYGEISRLIFHGRFSARSSALFQMLEEVCRIEDEETGCSLGSVVVRADSGIPGKGYYAFAADGLGRPVDPADPASCRAFWEGEVAKTWDTYSA
jgi:hypothetical protein